MAKNKVLYFCWLSLLFTHTVQSQNITKEMADFDEFVRQQKKEFSDFVNEQNREFIQFLKENWKSYNSEQTEVRTMRPEPIAPVKVERNTPPAKPVRIDISSVQKIPAVEPSVEFSDLSGIKKTDPDDYGKSVLVEDEIGSFNFYGISCKIGLLMKDCVHLNGVSENEVASGWEKLCKMKYQSLVDECLYIKESYKFNDYAYLLFTYMVASELLSSKDENDIILLQSFILCQSGYKVKMARIGNELGLLYASNNLIYDTSYLNVDGEKYYIWGEKVNDRTNIYTYERNFADSKYLISMGFHENPDFSGSVITRTLQSKRYPNMKVVSQVHEGLVDFYRNYPQCDFSVYLSASVSEALKQTVVDALKECIAGKSKLEAANMLIDFVQTAFAYKTDNEQFGYEKPFFIDELFYYPYCDCEDRAIFYAYLVRTLLHLDVVLLDYPNHVATAVYFGGENVEGDYVMVNGKKYIICDPTYIGASIGMVMPQFKSVSAKVLIY